VVHQHGCGEGSCKSGQTGAFDLHWQALASKHKCALLSPVYEQPGKEDCQLWCDPRNGSDEAFQKSLLHLGIECGHPELATVPWALWGHSGGGHWAGGMLMLHPERIAAVWLRSGVPVIGSNEGRFPAYAIPEAATRVPTVCNLGTKEGVTVKDGRFARVWGGVETFFRTMRDKESLIAVAVDPLTAHECGNQRYLAIPWFDAILSARLPDKEGAELKPMPTEQTQVAPLYTGASDIVDAVPMNSYQGELKSSVWLPNAKIAKLYSKYISNTAVPDITAPPAPWNITSNGNELTWGATADLESGLAYFIIHRDGKFLARVPEKDQPRFGRPIFQGQQYSDTPIQPLVEMRYVDTTAKKGNTYEYRVYSVNTVGLKSK